MDRASDFGVFVQQNADELRRAAWLLTGNPEDASDLVQETLTRLYPKWVRVARAESPLAYVRKCMLRQYLSESRRRRLHTVPDTHVAEQFDPADRIDNLSTQLLIATHLKRLTPAQRTSLVLKFYFDMSDHDACRLMRCPQTTYRSHLARGLRTLRKHMASGSSEPGATPPRGVLR